MKFYVTIIVFIAGAAVLALEILGTRILGPFYGVDLFLWSALISVTLAALSAGYVLGGHWADRGATVTSLCVVLAIAGAWIVAIPWIRHPLLALIEPLGLRSAVLAAAGLLFFPPLALLGTVSPIAIKLRTESLGELGRTAGFLYAVSTAASVFSALLTGFFLIPNVGVSRLTLIAGGTLILTALAGFLLRRKPVHAITAAVLLALGAAGWGASAEGPDPGRGLLAITQSRYAELRVLDTEAGRHLLIDGGIHSLADTATWDSYFHYAAVLDLPKYFFGHPGNLLLIGLGGGSIAKQYARAGWQVDAVEIDPAVAGIASRYFNLRDSDARVYPIDGRQYLASTAETYDVIIVDAFGSSSIPFHLVTKEVFGLFSRRLKPGGILALNVEALGWHDPIVGSLAATLRTQFAAVVALPIEEPPNRFGNIVLLASDSPLEPIHEPERNELLDPDWRYGPGYQKVHAWDNRFTPEISGAAIFTDDLNPVDIRAQAINLAARKDLHEYFGKGSESW